MKIMPIGLDNVIQMSEESRKRAFVVAHSGGGGGVNSKEEGMGGEKPSDARKEKIWKFGEKEFEALMRCLDNAVSILLDDTLQSIHFVPPFRDTVLDICIVNPC